MYLEWGNFRLGQEPDTPLFEAAPFRWQVLHVLGFAVD
jgi:hypothetical protein